MALLATVHAPPRLRRALALGLVVVAVAVASSCGGDKPDARASTPRPSTTAGPRSWTYPDEAGVAHTVVEDDDIEFVSGVPEPVALMAALNDCDAVGREATYWHAQTQRHDYSEQYRANASAYAAFGNDRLKALGCG